MATPTTPVTVRVVFGNCVSNADNAISLTIHTQADGSDSIYGVKQLIAQAAGGRVTADDLLLSFGPNDRKMGKQYVGDPAVDEKALRLAQYSALGWLERFPAWSLTARLLPAAPPPPGVAIQRAAAVAEHKDPDRAVQDARSKGEIPKINDLPAPWGPKPHVAPPAEELAHHLPPNYPQHFSPLVDV
jgi:hypothetical protein